MFPEITERYSSEQHKINTPKFTRPQLVLVVRSILAGAADQIQSSLPPVIPQQEAQGRQTELRNYVHGVINTVGIQIPILYAALTNDGLGAGDFPEFTELNHLATEYMRVQCGYSSIPADEDGTFPNIDRLAESVVNTLFNDYLKS